MGYESIWLPPLQTIGSAGIGHDRSDRINGWKSVAAYFGRDRTTVIRWTRERALPVYRLPGGKTATIYALKSELDRWAQARDGVSVADERLISSAILSASPPIEVGKSSTQNWRRWTIGLGGLLLAVGATATAGIQTDAPIKSSASKAAPLALPSDPMIARKFLTARDLTAGRDAQTLEQSIILLEQVVVAAPQFAPGQSSLAEALLLSREFGMRKDTAAFRRARSAARAAVRLAPDMAAGHRMLGFIAYWADQDFTEADESFKKALALVPDDALSQFWYGNVLSDHGDHAAALKMLNNARLLQPGSIAIQTDLAWAQWSTGDDAAPLKDLQDIAARNPGFAVVHDCLADIALARGDLTDYVQHFTRYAKLRGDGELLKRADALDAALKGGVDVLWREVVVQANADAEPRRTLVLPALLASVARDRAQLKNILLKAERRDESWGNSGFLVRISRAWAGDDEMVGLIALRRGGRG